MARPGSRSPISARPTLSTSAASPCSAATTIPTSRSSSPPPARASTQNAGVGFLISKDGGKTWNLYDSTNNVDANGNLLPIESTAATAMFVGNTSFGVVVDPKLTPTGQVIIYAAMSGPNGGIWRSEDTGQTWAT